MIQRVNDDLVVLLWRVGGVVMWGAEEDGYTIVCREQIGTG